MSDVYVFFNILYVKFIMQMCWSFQIQIDNFQVSLFFMQTYKLAKHWKLLSYEKIVIILYLRC